jgi:hypothetical protein
MFDDTIAPDRLAAWILDMRRQVQRIEQSKYEQAPERAGAIVERIYRRRRKKRYGASAGGKRMR